MSTPEVRVITVRPRTIVVALGITVLVGLVLVLGYLAWNVLTWILIAILLAAALNPAVEAFERRGMGRGWAATLVFFFALSLVTGIGFLVIPPVVTQVTDFVDAVPDLIDDLTAGRGPLGFLQDEYQIVDRIREAIEKEGAAGVLGLSEPVLDIVRSVVTAVVGVITIIFLTYFMLLEGPRTIAGFLGLLPESTRPRYERVGRDVYRAISGYVTGNLLISLVAGTLSAVVLFAVGSDYAVALGLLVAVLDLIPLAGATLAAILVSTVIFIETACSRSCTEGRCNSRRSRCCAPCSSALSSQASSARCSRSRSPARCSRSRARSSCIERRLRPRAPDRTLRCRRCRTSPQAGMR